ncbi:hypothetical protein [Lysinibacillus sp.]|uniref:hypothetical protein n=1 Tax=Lysinibacillus sp. TaxID=1869345 RepID=UPI0028A6B268|nr:hypothetical protein [Lysinibacillus sp.]
MKQSTERIQALVRVCDFEVYNLSAQMVELEVVQGAVASLIERIDEIHHNGWNEERGMATLCLKEIQDSVRLIDMAFYPLFKEMNSRVDKLHNNSSELHELVHAKEENKKADAPTSTK